MREIESCEDRLRSMMVLDKQEGVYKLNKILKAELLYLLKNYFETTAEDVDVVVVPDKFGGYELNVKVRARAIKIVHVFNDV